jgi:hypothetical protein
MEEVVRAFNYVIEKGWVSAFLVNYVGFGLKSFKAFYWGTSEWSAEAIEEAHRVFSTLSLIFR